MLCLHFGYDTCRRHGQCFHSVFKLFSTHVLLKNRTGCLKSETVLFFLIKKKHPRVMASGKAPLITGHETVRADVNENFCFMEEAEQGPGASKAPGRNMKGRRGKVLHKIKKR